MFLAESVPQDSHHAWSSGGLLAINIAGSFRYSDMGVSPAIMNGYRNSVQ